MPMAASCLRVVALNDRQQLTWQPPNDVQWATLRGGLAVSGHTGGRQVTA